MGRTRDDQSADNDAADSDYFQHETLSETIKRIGSLEPALLAGRVEDAITPEHRELVADMAAADCRHETMAHVLGVAKETMQRLFANELEHGYELVTTGVVRAIKREAMGGNVKAMDMWSSKHPKANWRSRSELTGKDGGELVPPERAKNEEILAALMAGIDKIDAKKVETKKLPAPKKGKKEKSR